MKPWMLPWLLPLGMLGAVVFVAVTGRYAALLVVVVVGVLLVPVLWRLHPASADDDTHYWRIKRL